MGNLRILVVLTVLCAIIGEISAQNRGSSRYVPPADDYDGDSARIQRPTSSRVTSGRRQRPAPVPEPTEIEDAPPRSYQPPQTSNREGTTGRRVPSRTAPQSYAPPSPPEPHLPEDPALPFVPQEPPSPPPAPETKQQGRRRRTKKRKRPVTKPTTEAAHLDPESPENSKATSPDLLDPVARQPQPYANNAENVPQPSYGSDLEDKPLWSNNNYADNGDDTPDRISIPSKYYPPRSGTNRLPMEDTEDDKSSRRYADESPPVSNQGTSNSRGYSESSPSDPNQGIPSRRYVPPSVAAEPPSRSSYVPILQPIRVPSEGTSRLPHEEYQDDIHKDTQRDRHSGSFDHRSPQRTPSNRSPSLPVADPSAINRNSGAKPPQDNIYRNEELDIPKRAHSEVRLPQPEDVPSDRNYNNEPKYDGTGDILNRYQEEERPVEGNINQDSLNPTNRLPNPSEVHYDSAYPSYLDKNVENGDDSGDSNPRQSHGTVPHTSRNVIIPFTDVREDPVKSNKDDIDTGRRNTRYQPPIQRSGSRYNAESSDGPSRLRTSENSPPTEVPTRSRGISRNRQESSSEGNVRTRGASRYQPESSNDTPESPRGSSSRYQPETAVDAPARTRGSSSRYQPESSDDAPARTRGLSRYQPESSIDTPTRTSGSQIPEQSVQAPRSRNTHRYRSEQIESSRRQPVNPEAPVEPERTRGSSSYRQIVAPSPPENVVSPRDHIRPPFTAPIHSSEEEPQFGTDPIRETIRSRPQYEPRDAPQPYLYEEPLNDEPSPYAPEHPAPRQQDNHDPAPQRSPPSREQSRQSHRRENTGQRSPVRQRQADYPSPQHNAREQPQYQAPPREPGPPRQPARQQSRPRQSDPAPVPTRPRSSGGSKFTCPEPYGFFPDPVQCDRYHECRNGTAYDNLCQDGLAFNELNAPKYLRCDSLRDVDCSKRPELQEARPTKNCPRRFGLYPHETDCTKFWNCVDGTATEVQCPPGLTFNDDRATCDWADLVKTSCKTEDLLGFTCPEPNAFDLQDGVYTSYPHPENCQLHFVCIKGVDGERRPRMLSCNEGLVYSPESSSCTRPDNVPGCEDFYGIRSPPPKRKPSREPLPREPEEPEEEPRRRVPSGRRTRN